MFVRLLLKGITLAVGKYRAPLGVYLAKLGHFYGVELVVFGGHFVYAKFAVVRIGVTYSTAVICNVVHALESECAVVTRTVCKFVGF